jgi:hypothetical protein
MLDLRRRNAFKEKPSRFTEESRTLGLFQTRMPRFSQLFFYDFSEEEVCQKQGQLGSGLLASERAATTYLDSNVRLESKCGISDVWYWCLEQSARLYGEEATSVGRQGKYAQSDHPRLHPYHMELFINRLGWRELHRGLLVERRIKKRRLAVVPRGGEDFATEDYVPSSIPEERELRIP